MKEKLESEVVKAGFRLATSWEDEYMVYACSLETIPGCYGHPRFEASFCKRTEWLRIGKYAPVKLGPSTKI